jgi:membrane-bound lytic murein transglycosylase B
MKHGRASLIRAVIFSLLGTSLSACASSPTLTERTDVREFIDEMVARYDFHSDELRRLFQQARYRQDVIDAISRPAERKPWYQYRPLFLSEKRIDGGVEFWEANREALQRASDTFGVPPEIIAAIIGVETFYGRQTGRYRVLDSLTTLAFDYPPRREFFRGELEQFLLLTREEGLDALQITGSYAGAMGPPQFIASSYRTYAIDFAGDGHTNLLTNMADAIGSVANYLKAKGWQHDGPIAVPAAVSGDDYAAVVEKGLKPHTSVRDLAARGIKPREAIADGAAAALLRLDSSETSQEYWLVFDNFSVLMQYNRSPLYAMAVCQLADEIRSRHSMQTARR